MAIPTLTDPVDLAIERPFTFAVEKPHQCTDNTCISVSCCDLDENFMTLLYQVRIPLANFSASIVSNALDALIVKIMNVTVDDNASNITDQAYTSLLSSVLSSFASVPDNNALTVDVMVRYRLVRVSKKHVKGKILYSTTLLPGEKSKIFASSSHSDSTYNASSKNREYNESTSVEGSFMNAVQNSMTNHAYNASSSTNQQNHSSNSSWNAGGSAGLNLGIVSIGGGGGGGGSSSDFSSAVDMSSQFVDSIHSAASQAAISVSSNRTTNIRESSSDTNIQTETNATVGAYTREIHNANKACPVTYYFRSIDKCMEVRLELVNVGFRYRVPNSINTFNPVPHNRPVLVNIKPATINGNDLDALKLVKNRLLLDAVSGTGNNDVQFSTQGVESSVAATAGTNQSLFQRFTAALTGNVTTTVQQAAISNNGDTANLTFVPLNSAAPPALPLEYLKNNIGNTVSDKLNKLQWFTALITLMIASRMTCTSVDKDVLDNGTRENKIKMVNCLKKVLSAPIRLGNTIMYDFVRDCWPALTPDADMCDADKNSYIECNKCRGLISWSKDIRLPSDGVATDSCIGSSVYEDYEIDTKSKLVDLRIKETRATLLDTLASAIKANTINPDVASYIDLYKNLEGQCCLAKPDS